MRRLTTMHRHDLARRTLDIAISIAALLVIWPLLVVVAILVRLDSRGPVLFRQPRVGRDQKMFNIYKFRTMAHRDSVDQYHEPVLRGSGDKRITRVGRILRILSIDELPQIINVLRGEMTLVGPRPILPEQLAAVPPDKMSRFDALPGITGLAQIRGRRNLDWLRQLEYDCEYVKSRSVWRDAAILVKTIPVVIRGAGVYSSKARNWREYLESDSSLIK